MRSLLCKLGWWLYSRSPGRIPEVTGSVDDLYARYRELSRRVDEIVVRDVVRRMWATSEGRETLERLFSQHPDGTDR